MEIEGPAGTLSYVEQGTGPLVLLVHGFPETKETWTGQLEALASAGYRAVALDVRGYGGSVKPEAIDAYRMLGHVADNVAMVEALGASRAAIIGHDWGSPIAAATAQLRPDRFAALGMLGVPFTPRASIRPSAAFDRAGGDEEFYVSYFQEPGRAEAEIEPDLEGWLRGLIVALDSEGPDAPGWFSIPRGGQLRDRLPTDAPLPAWLSRSRFDAHVQALRRGGMTAPLNRYRNVDRDWEDMAAFASLPIEQPAIYIAGAADSSTVWLADAVAAQGNWLPALDGVHLLEGAGHWVHRERAGEVNTLLTGWLDRVYQ